MLPEYWAESHFYNNRYRNLTSNIAKFINSWVLEARKKSILAMLEQISHQLMEWFVQRRRIDQHMEGLLVSSAANIIQNSLRTRARRYRILGVNSDIMEVFRQKQ